MSEQKNQPIKKNAKTKTNKDKDKQKQEAVSFLENKWENKV